MFGASVSGAPLSASVGPGVQMTSSRNDPTRVIQEIRTDIERFLYTSDTVALVGREQQLLASDDRDEPLPTTLPQAWKAIKALETQIVNLQSDIAARDQELSVARSVGQVHNSQHAETLQLQVARLERRLEEQKLEAAEAAAAHAQALAEARREVAAVESHERALMDIDKRRRDELDEQDTFLATTRAHYEAKIRTLSQEKASLEQELADAQHTIDQNLRTLETQLREANAQNELITSDVQGLQNLVTMRDARIEDLRDELRNTRESLTEAQAQASQSASTAQADAELRMLVDQLQSELQRLRGVREERDHYRNQCDALTVRMRNVELLTSQLEEATARERRHEEELTRLAAIEIAHDRLVADADAWRRELGSHLNAAEFDSIAELAAYTAQLQHELLQAVDKQHGKVTESATLRGTASQATEAAAQATAERDAYQQELRVARETLKRTKAKMLRLQAERDGLHNAVAFYEADQDSQLAGTDPADPVARAQAQVDEARARAAALETHNAALEASVAAIQQELDAVRAGTSQHPLPMEISVLREQRKAETQVAGDSSQTRKAETAEAAVEELTKVNKKLAARLEAAEIECAQLREAAGTGTFNPKTTKVLHFSMNPQEVAERKAAETEAARVAALEAENAALRAKIEGTGVAPMAIDGTASGVSSGRVAELEQQIAELEGTVQKQETRHTRLKEVFTKMSKEYKEVTYLLLGYQIDMKNKGEYMLRSMYAEKEEDALCFERTSDGDLFLLETPFAASLGQEVDAYLRRCHSIPAFLSHVTMKLFNLQTFQG